MRILHVVENLDSRYGGPAKSVPFLAKYLAQLGFKNKIFTVKEYEKENNPVLDECDCDIYKANVVNFLGGKKFRFAPSFEKMLEKEITDNSIIHIHGIWTYPMYCAYKLALKYNVPYVVSTRGMVYEWSLKQNGLVKKIMLDLFVRDMLKNAEFIHITEPNEEKELANIGIKNICRLVPNGIELEKKYEGQDEAVLEAINYNPDKFYIMYLGRIVKKKGLHYLINVLKEDEKTELLVVGNIEDEKYFKTLKKKKNVRFLGQLDGLQKHTVFKIADLFVLPTYSENFGIVIAEAMSYKLPVITTTGTPWKEIKKKNAGWWIDLSEENLFRALEEALNCSKECLKQKGENGYEIIKNYTWDKQALKMKKYYEEIIKG